MVFITGANGLVGSFIARKFLSEGHEVVGLKRAGSNLDSIADIREKINWVEGDILDLKALEKYLKGVELVVHCAAMVSYDRTDKEALFRTNVDGVANIVNVCLKNKVKKLLFVSSIASFGTQINGSLTEKSKKNLAGISSNYGLAKYLAELEVWRGGEEGLKTIIINPSVVIGPGDWNKSSGQLFRYVWRENKFVINGSMNYVDARDVAEITYRLSTKNISGEQFIVNAGQITYQELFRKIAAGFGKKPPRIKLSGTTVKIAYVLDQVSSFITGRKARLTKELSRITKGATQFNNKKIVEALSYDFKPIDESIRWTCSKLINLAEEEKKT